MGRLEKIRFILGVTTSPVQAVKLFFAGRTHRKKEGGFQWLSIGLKFGKLRTRAYLRPAAGDLYMFYEVFKEEMYKLPVEVKVEYILDLGANIGLSALYFHSQYPTATILAVEPDADNLEGLRKNIQGLVSGKIKIVEGAISSAQQVLKLEDGVFKFNTRVSKYGNRDVQGHTVESIMQAFGIHLIDLVKIDIEGFEADLFSKNTDWLRKTGRVVMECHSPQLLEICRRKLESYSFECRTGNGLMLFGKNKQPAGYIPGGE